MCFPLVKGDLLIETLDWISRLLIETLIWISRFTLTSLSVARNPRVLRGLGRGPGVVGWALGAGV